MSLRTSPNRAAAMRLVVVAAGLLFAQSSARAGAVFVVFNNTAWQETNPSGGGTLVLNSSNTYVGGAIIETGTLFLGGSGAINQNPPFDIDAADLSILAPGTDFVGGSLSLDFGSISLFDGSGYELFDFANIDFGGSFTELGWSGFAWDGQTWIVYPADGILFFTAIPEPASSAALLGLAAVGIAGSRRRRRQARA